MFGWIALDVRDGDIIDPGRCRAGPHPREHGPTAAAGPASNASTDPSRRLRTWPARPKASAVSAVQAR